MNTIVIDTDNWKADCPFCGWIFFDSTGEIGETPCEHLVIDIDFEWIYYMGKGDPIGIQHVDNVDPKLLNQIKDIYTEEDDSKAAEAEVIELLEVEGNVLNRYSHEVSGCCGCCGGGEQLLVWKK